jgi:hypothetical protein
MPTPGAGVLPAEAEDQSNRFGWKKGGGNKLLLLLWSVLLAVL